MLNGLARPAALTITTVDGRRYSAATISPKGSPLNRLTENDLLDKFRVWTAPTFSAARQEQIIDAVRGVDAFSDVKDLASLLAADTGA